MDDYVGNSNRGREGKQEAPQPTQAKAKPKFEPVITGTVVQRKTPLRRRISATFFGGNPRAALKHVFTNVLVPGAKNVVADAAYQGVDKLIFNEVRNPAYRNMNGGMLGGIFGGGVGGPMITNFTPTPYNQFSNPQSQAANQILKGMSTPNAARPNLGEIVLTHRHEAEEVIAKMTWAIQEFTFVSVSDLYDMLKMPADFAEEKYGWTDVRQLGIKPVPGGYLLVLPSPQPLT